MQGKKVTRQTKVIIKTQTSSKRTDKATGKRSERVTRAMDDKKAAALPIVNVNVGSHANLQIVDLSTRVNVQPPQSHSEEVLFEQTKNAYLANPAAFMSGLGTADKKNLS